MTIFPYGFEPFVILAALALAGSGLAALFNVAYRLGYKRGRYDLELTVTALHTIARLNLWPGDDGQERGALVPKDQ